MMARLGQLTLFVKFESSKSGPEAATRALKKGREEKKKDDPALSITKGVNVEGMSTKACLSRE